MFFLACSASIVRREARDSKASSGRKPTLRPVELQYRNCMQRILLHRHQLAHGGSFLRFSLACSFRSQWRCVMPRAFTLSSALSSGWDRAEAACDPMAVGVSSLVLIGALF